jgi:hypothetical protein
MSKAITTEATAPEVPVVPRGLDEYVTSDNPTMDVLSTFGSESPRGSPTVLPFQPGIDEPANASPVTRTMLKATPLEASDAGCPRGALDTICCASLETRCEVTKVARRWDKTTRAIGPFVGSMVPLSIVVMIDSMELAL